MVTRDIQAFFIGTSAWAGKLREEWDGRSHRYFINRPNKWFPFWKKWTPLFTGAIYLMEDYYELPIFDVANNKICERKVRIYSFGLNDLKVILRNMTNAELLHAYEAEKMQRSFWENLFYEARDKLSAMSGEDRAKQWMLDWFSFFDDKMKSGAQIAMANKLAEQNKNKK